MCSKGPTAHWAPAAAAKQVRVSPFDSFLRTSPVDHRVDFSVFPIFPVTYASFLWEPGCCAWAFQRGLLSSLPERRRGEAVQHGWIDVSVLVGEATQFFWKRRGKQNCTWFINVVFTGPEGWFQKSFHHPQNLPCSSCEAPKY